jgi:P-type E1-E2 ATPase
MLIIQRVPASYLRRGDKIVVEPHTTIPCDCYVLEGSSLIGQAIVTGESLPARKNAGDFLLGGTRNLSSRLVCAVQREKNDSFYTKLVQSAVESSSTSLNDHEFIDTITRHFVAVVMGLAFFAPCYSQYPLIGKVPMYQIVHGWITHTITILTCACPCAISLAIPSAVVAAIGT